MSELILGVGDASASNASGTRIKTFALGSCIAVIILDAQTRTVGMAHVALPNSSINPARAKMKPGLFADTCVPHLLELMTQLGCSPGGRGMNVKLCGGAAVLDMSSRFDIGRKNIVATQEHLVKFGLTLVAEDVGGQKSRTVEVDVDSGRIILSSSNGEVWEI